MTTMTHPTPPVPDRSPSTTSRPTRSVRAAAAVAIAGSVGFVARTVNVPAAVTSARWRSAAIALFLRKQSSHLHRPRRGQWLLLVDRYDRHRIGEGEHEGRVAGLVDESFVAFHRHVGQLRALS